MKLTRVKNENIAKALTRIDKFCSNHDISYIITGTLAMNILGLDVQPNDIDLLINSGLSNKQRDAIQDIVRITGGDEVCHEGYECTDVIINGIKINLILNDSAEKDAIDMQSSVIVMVDNNLVRVQNVDMAIRRKMELRRPKDNQFMLDFINHILNITK